MLRCRGTPASRFTRSSLTKRASGQFLPSTFPSPTPPSPFPCPFPCIICSSLCTFITRLVVVNNSSRSSRSLLFTSTWSAGAATTEARFFHVSFPFLLSQPPFQVFQVPSTEMGLRLRLRLRPRLRPRLRLRPVPRRVDRLRQRWQAWTLSASGSPHPMDMFEVRNGRNELVVRHIPLLTLQPPHRSEGTLRTSRNGVRVLEDDTE